MYCTLADYVADICAVMPELNELLNIIIVIITQLTRLFSQTYRDITVSLTLIVLMWRIG